MGPQPLFKDVLDLQNPQLDRVFHALAHPTRRTILRDLAGGERSISEVAAPFPVSLEAVSQHIRVLEGAGLVRRTRRGRVHHCRMRKKPLLDAARVLAHLSEYWGQSLDSLEQFLAATGEPNTPNNDEEP